jgi:hypothetical protein
MVLAALAALGAGLIEVGCGGGAGQARPRSVRELVNDDLASLAQFDASGAQEVDAQDHGAFTKIFGGTTGADIRRYLDERVAYFSTPDEQASLRVEPATYGGVDLKERYFAFDNESGSSLQTLGQNSGAAIWKNHILEFTPTVYVAGRTIRLASTRPGFVQLSDGYNLRQTLFNFVDIGVPPAYREVTLVHEARHSDCPGGLKPRPETRSYNRFSANDEQYQHCTQEHAICMSGVYAGAAACDKFPWGAYSVALVYAKAASAHMTGMAKQIMVAVIADQIVRLSPNFDVEAMLQGKLGDPDMSSDNSMPAAAAAKSRGEFE